MPFNIIDYQRRLNNLGLYTGALDGIAGNGTELGFDAVFDFYEANHAKTAPAAPTPPASTLTELPPGGPSMAWGARVSSVFRDRVRWICSELGFNPDWLMSCMAWESGETFSSGVTNMAGSGAVGLIQFMPSTAKALGTTTAALAALSAEDQLRYVYSYLAPFKGRVHTLSDLYMTILWPAGVGKAEDYNLGWSGITYRQNAGLDTNKNGVITKAEAAQHVADKLTKGLKLAA